MIVPLHAVCAKTLNINQIAQIHRVPGVPCKEGHPFWPSRTGVKPPSLITFPLCFHLGTKEDLETGIPLND